MRAMPLRPETAGVASHPSEQGGRWASTITRALIWLPLPILAGFLIAALMDSPLQRITTKGFEERLALVLLGSATFTALAAAVFRGSAARWWITLLASSLFLREIHFEWTTTGIYVALGVLFGYALVCREQLRVLWRSPAASTCLAGAFWFYAVAVTIDAAFWRFLPGFANWRTPVEESLESLGHLHVLALCVMTAVGSGDGWKPAADAALHAAPSASGDAERKAA